jgi:hypothetical protein
MGMSTVLASDGVELSATVTSSTTPRPEQPPDPRRARPDIGRRS